jgi:hypothetical protein
MFVVENKYGSDVVLGWLLNVEEASYGYAEVDANSEMQ